MAKSEHVSVAAMACLRQPGYPPGKKRKNMAPEKGPLFGGQFFLRGAWVLSDLPQKPSWAHAWQDLRSVWETYYMSTRDIWHPPVSAARQLAASLDWRGTRCWCAPRTTTAQSSQLSGRNPIKSSFWKISSERRFFWFHGKHPGSIRKQPCL